MSLERANTDHPREALQKYFGYSDFHPLQEEIIKNVLDRQDVLVVIPTGGGKSLCYQLPAVMNEGVTVVVSPLIALMKDQVDDLNERGISAVSINSALTYEEIDATKERLLKQDIKLLYVAPERIFIPDFLDFLRRLDISLFAIDEAHCISEWGHEFRPEYRKLNLLKENFPNVPLIALTSTAIPQVQADIVSQLNMCQPRIYQGSLNRKNLYYEIKPKNKDMFRQLLRYIKNHPDESGIIYCQSRKSVDKLARDLKGEGIRALPYHAGLSADTLTKNQDKFVRDDVDIIVATIAFGMGIDKSNIRYVIHCDMPKSIEGYYQETGRAGRDGLKSDCILFYSYADKMKQEYFIRQIEDAQNRQVAFGKLSKMIDFCTWSKCRRVTLLNYFGEKYDTPSCNMCDTCAPAGKTEMRARAEPEAIIPRAKKDIDSMINGLLERGELFRLNGSPRPAELAATTSGRPEKSPPRPKRPAPEPAEANPLDAVVVEPPRAGECDQKLFGILRTVRKQIADKRHVPPYMVFSDVALKDMATKYPQTPEAFLQINGVGEVKLKKYGQIFTNIIADYCQTDKSAAYAVPEIEKEYQCRHCQGVTQISVIKGTDQAAIPAIRFCPFCGKADA